jgi:hypothetical protein
LTAPDSSAATASMLPLSAVRSIIIDLVFPVVRPS